MKKQLKTLLHRITAITLSLFMLTGLMIIDGLTAYADDATLLSNPVMTEDDSVAYAKARTTWDCIWFGNYPQTEIVKDRSECGLYGRCYASDSDCIVDLELYTSLSEAAESEWDSNGEITIDGTKYRRIQKTDASYTSTEYTYYKWKNSSAVYHYFRYEPVKWRVLKVDSNKAFLLADEILDVQKYNDTYNSETTWSTSMVRSWLNGYDSTQNTAETDYSGKNFINSAFSVEEQEAILETDLEECNDKIFLISLGEMNRDTGFNTDTFTDDCNETIVCQSSTLAKAMGAYTMYVANSNENYKKYWFRNSDWKLRDVNSGVGTQGNLISSRAQGVRPAITLDLTSSLWSYAGTVNSKKYYYKVSKTGTGSGEVYLDTDYDRFFSGDTLNIEDELTIQAEAADGSRLMSLTVNGADAKDGDSVTVTEDITITAEFSKAAEIPEAVENLVYNESEQTGVASGEGYTITGNTATEPGNYTATATLEDDYVWSDGTSEPKTIDWSIAKRSYALTITKTGAGESEIYLEQSGSETDNIKYKTGDNVVEGDNLVLRANVTEGSKLVKLTINGAEASNGDSVTVTGKIDIEANVVKKTEAPQAETDLIYNGKEQTGVEAAEGYTLTGNTATNAGQYTATATLKSGYVWSDGTTGTKTVTWSISKAKQNVKISVASKTVKKVVIRKKAYVVKSPIKVTGAKGKVTYTKFNSKSYAYTITKVNKKNGNITMIKHPCEKVTKSHTIKVKVNAAATRNYAAYEKTVKVKITMK